MYTYFLLFAFRVVSVIFDCSTLFPMFIFVLSAFSCLGQERVAFFCFLHVYSTELLTNESYVVTVVILLVSKDPWSCGQTLLVLAIMCICAPGGHHSGRFVPRLIDPICSFRFSFLT